MSAAAQLMPLLTQAPAEALLRALPVAVYTTDADGYITFYNQAAAEFWGRSPGLGEERWCGSCRLYWAPGRAPSRAERPPAAAGTRGAPGGDLGQGPGH